MKKLLTISVAAYNLETMIEQNLKSFAACKNKDRLEVIVTNDGSKDNTASIVEKYVDEYPDVFRLINQENSGAGSTVNSGIRNATGKYFKMIDGDDWVISENLDLLLDELEKTDSDMILTNMQVYNESLKKITKYEKVGITPCRRKDFSEVCSDLLINMHFVMYKTSILKENNILLDNGFYTDVEYLLLPIPFVNTVDVYDLDIYVYRIARAGQSVSISSMQKHIDMHDLVLKRLINFYNNIDKNEKININIKKYIKNRISYMADVQLGTILSFNNKNTQEEVKKFNEFIKGANSEIYELYSNKIKCKILIRSNYKLTKLLSYIYIKKNS